VSASDDVEPPVAVTDAERPGRTTFLTLTFPGLVGALVVFALSLTPSLLPRPWLYEGLVAGVGAVLGYAIGSVIWWAVRRIWRRPPVPAVHRRGWIALAVIAPIVVLGSLAAGYRWQNQVRELVGEPTSPQGHFLLIALVSAVVFVVVLLLARAVRWVTRKVTSLLGRLVPRQLAHVVAVVGWRWASTGWSPVSRSTRP
jgi:uncharacterized membrane protein